MRNVLFFFVLLIFLSSKSYSNEKVVIFEFTKEELSKLKSHSIKKKTDYSMLIDQNGTCVASENESAGLRRLRDGTGDITFLPVEGTKVYWLMLWPHVRPFNFRRVQPLLRGIDDPDSVARLLVNVIEEMRETWTEEHEATQIAAV